MLIHIINISILVYVSKHKVESYLHLFCSVHLQPGEIFNPLINLIDQRVIVAGQPGAGREQRVSHALRVNVHKVALKISVGERNGKHAERNRHA